MTTRSVPAAAGLAVPREPYDRARWERAVILSDLHRGSRLVALVLSHYADGSGHLAQGGIQESAALQLATGLTGKNVRLSMKHLQHRGFLTRPDICTWSRQDVVRPVTLTMPPAAARPEPPHSGEAG